jgi:hypothetical protein
MCIVVIDNREKIASKNIICTKKIRSNHTSEYLDFQYEKNVVNKVNNIDVPNNIGFHSRNINSVFYKNKKTYNSSNYIFIIPKGSKYYIGGENEKGIDNYISEKIVFTGIKNSLLGRLIVKIKYKI